ncbi:MAG: phage tail sheath subtilisin-like domain-containing protein [Myxococcota bacterium]|nr:phage tail sheath subtilisin-like domain-containing protein [Myxococcota bacterium]
MQFRPPGIYPATRDRRYTPVQMVKSGVVGFVGITQKGPTNTPVRLTDTEQFRDIFGRLPFDTYLETAVKGFFDNGGSECYVLRVCHLQERGRGEIARRAQARLRDANEKLTVLVEANSEGSWGNDIRVAVKRPEARVQTFLTLDMHAGDVSATIRSTHGFRRGTVVRIYDDEHSEYRTVTELDGKTIQWRLDAPMERPFKSGAPTYIEPVEFELEVETLERREVYRELSFAPNSDNYFPRVINNTSRLVQVMDMRNGSSVSEQYPVESPEEYLQGGTDGIFNITPDDFIGLNIGPTERYGLAAFEAIDAIDLLALPDLFWAHENSSGFRTLKDVEVVQQALVSQCERMRNRFAVLDLPNHRDYVQALQWRLLFDSAYAAFYFPWLVIEVNGETKPVPPSGHVAGIYARCDDLMGVHRAPANEALEGVLDLSLLLTDSDIGYLNQQGVNTIKSFAKRGMRVWGARTVSSDPMHRFINVRRTISGIIRAMERNLQWVVFEPNDIRLWKSISYSVSFFLLGLWKQGYFRGRSPEEAFYVKCDAETNPPEIREAGQVIVEVGVAPVRPAEFIVFRVSEESAEFGPVSE